MSMSKLQLRDPRIDYCFSVSFRRQVIMGAFTGVWGGSQNPQNRGEDQGLRPACALAIAKISVGPSGPVNTSSPTFSFSTEWGDRKNAG